MWADLLSYFSTVYDSSLHKEKEKQKNIDMLDGAGNSDNQQGDIKA
jgi:hypothetical protein